MTTDTTHRRRIDRQAIGILVVMLLAAAAYGTRSTWTGTFYKAVAYLKNQPSATTGNLFSDQHDMAGHDSYEDDNSGRAHASHDDDTASGESVDSIRLTQDAWANLGLVTGVVKTSNYARSVRVAATVVERSGRSLVQIPAPVTGVVTEVYAVERDLISPQQPLFEIQLTHEDVVTAQTDFLEHLHHKAARLAELKRLRKIGSEIIAGKRIIEQQYKYDEAVEKVEGLRQGLLLHGLSKTQIATIESSRELLRKVTVVAPPFADLTNSDQRFYHLQKLEVRRGAIVEAGSPLAVLADHSLLFVEGQAFEGDAQWLFRSVAEGAKVEVVPTSTSAVSNDPLRLEIQSVADRFDPMSRALKFYLLLPNEKLTRSESGQSGEKGFGGDFIGWKYRPGQPMEALLRTEDTYENHFVLPADAVVIDGPNAFVFEQNGDNFDRVDVRVLYRDKDTVVVKRNSRLIGSVIAMTAAFDMHLALKNAAGGPIDPHAGHTH